MTEMTFVRGGERLDACFRCEHTLRETARLIHEEREACRGRSGVTMPRRYESDILVCLRRTIDDIVRQFAAGTAREQAMGLERA